MGTMVEKAMCAAVVLGLLTAGNGWADCQQEYNKAIMMIGGAKQKALNNEKLNKDNFSAEFKPIIDAMQKDQCVNELMSLLRFIQEEQKLYPAPPGAPQTPQL